MFTFVSSVKIPYFRVQCHDILTDISRKSNTVLKNENLIPTWNILQKKWPRLGLHCSSRYRKLGVGNLVLMESWIKIFTSTSCTKICIKVSLRWTYETIFFFIKIMTRIKIRPLHSPGLSGTVVCHITPSTVSRDKYQWKFVVVTGAEHSESSHF